MRVLIFALLVAVTTAFRTIMHDDHQKKLDHESIVKIVNSDPKSTWKASVPFRFENATVADLKRMMGTIMPGDEGYLELPEREHSLLGVASIPESFDVRTAWPQCIGITGIVRDQSSCGSCWAFGSTEAFNARHCIKTGDTKTLFSPQDTLSCCSGFNCGMSQGCNGGQPSGAWKFFTTTGVVSGGDYADVGTGSSCDPYSLQSCAHHVAPPAGMVACDTLPEYDTPKCVSSCPDKSYKGVYSSDKHKASSSYSVKGVEKMQQELMSGGTLSVALTVYEDFPTYTSGVYQHKTGSSLGGHAVIAIGWGVENGTPYWLCVNSWNKSWGDQGTFKILRGSNECGIEGSVVAGEA
jgi:cathepsin B